jgi:RecB family exonuclease
MTPFLRQVAQHLLANHGTAVDKVLIVVPTRRAAFFAKQELANCISTPMISPSSKAIDDFVADSCQLQIIDSVSLLFDLYETFQQVNGAIDFDRFLGWASVLLSDFDKIDLYRVDPDYLFDYLSEANSYERWGEGLPTGRSFQETTGMDRYFTFFAVIRKVYTLLREKLLAKGKAYRGMAYRVVSDDTDQLLESVEQYSKIYFAGFNAFTESEKKIVSVLVDAGKAEVLWDADRYYMNANPEVEAGASMREYRKTGVFGDWKWMDDALLTQAKKITVYSVPNATLQTKVAGQIYKDMRGGGDLEGSDRDLSDSDTVPAAIVLGDENLLLPMLYSLDEGVTDFNVTMGLSLRSSMLYTLIDSVFELQQNVAEFQNKEGKVIKIPKFNHKSITKVLNHPFIRQYEQSVMRMEEQPSLIYTTLRRITEENRVFLTSDELLEMGENNELFRVLFTRWSRSDSSQILQTFFDLIDLLRSVYREYKNAIETEFLYLFYTLLQQFGKTLDEREERLSIRTLRSFMFELIRQTRIPFSGEPVSNLQVLGMLETRALDFERLIVLSVNEGIIPQAKRQNSLIPFDIAKEVGLPTHQHQEAVMSYHFYRLLQRADDIHLLYVSTNDAPGGGEKSRFIQQLQFELTQYNPAIQVVNKVVVLESGVVEAADEAIYKDEAMLTEIRRHLVTKGLYPTHLNQFIRCSMQFYLKHIVGVEEKEEMEEELGMDKIGSWIHKSLEELDIRYFLKGTDPEESDIKAVLLEVFEQDFAGYVTDIGLNRIYYQIGEQQVLAFFKHQMSQPVRRKALATEQSLRADLIVETSTQGEVPLVMGGKIDRVELSEEESTLYVMDYKTGSVAFSSKAKLENKEALLLEDVDIKAGYIRQLWLYQYLIYKKILKESGWKLKGNVYDSLHYRVQAGFYSFREPTAEFPNPIRLVESGNPMEFVQESERLLGIIIGRLLDPATPFVKTDDLEICRYCDYRGICGR